jgi:precorrin-6B methylase 2
MYEDLDFNAPLSDDRAARLIRALGPLSGATVRDFGCGWAELLIRIAAADPGVTVEGMDRDGGLIERGRVNAADLGVERRVTLHEGDAAGWRPEPADIVISIGSHHIWGSVADALDALRPLLRPGGRLLLGAETWMTAPTEAAMAALDSTEDEIMRLPDLVDLCTGRGLRPLLISEASADEWDEFESNYAVAWERWLLENPGHPEAETIRARADRHRAGWLRGYRGVLGFAYLILV